MLQGVEVLVAEQSFHVGASVVRYLARYEHRTAISDERIVSANDVKSRTESGQNMQQSRTAQE